MSARSPHMLEIEVTRTQRFVVPFNVVVPDEAQAELDAEAGSLKDDEIGDEGVVPEWVPVALGLNMIAGQCGEVRYLGTMMKAQVVGQVFDDTTEGQG